MLQIYKLIQNVKTEHNISNDKLFDIEAIKTQAELKI